MVTWFPLVEVYLINRRMEVLSKLWVIYMLSFLFDQELPCTSLAKIHRTPVKAEWFILQIWIIDGVCSVLLISSVKMRLSFIWRRHFLVCCYRVIVTVHILLISVCLRFWCTILVRTCHKVSSLSHHLWALSYHGLCFVCHNLAIVLCLTT